MRVELQVTHREYQGARRDPLGVAHLYFVRLESTHARPRRWVECLVYVPHALHGRLLESVDHGDWHPDRFAWELAVSETIWRDLIHDGIDGSRFSLEDGGTLCAILEWRGDLDINGPRVSNLDGPHLIEIHERQEGAAAER
jgi:hypothetical protein